MNEKGIASNKAIRKKISNHGVIREKKITVTAERGPAQGQKGWRGLVHGEMLV